MGLVVYLSEVLKQSDNYKGSKTYYYSAGSLNAAPTKWSHHKMFTNKSVTKWQCVTWGI